MSGVALLYITTTTTIIIITTIITIQYSGEQARKRGRQARYHGGRFENAKNCQDCKAGLGHIWTVICGIISNIYVDNHSSKQDLFIHSRIILMKQS